MHTKYIIKKRQEAKGGFVGRYDVRGETLPAAVPECVDEYFVVLDGDRAHRGAHIESTPLEHHTVLVVHARTFWEDEKGHALWILNVLQHSIRHKLPVLHLCISASFSAETSVKSPWKVFIFIILK